MGSRDEKDKTKVRKEKLAGYFYNLSQLIFTGTGVGGVLPFLHGMASSGDISVLVFGAVATAGSAYFANRIKILGFMSYLALFFMITSIVIIALIAWSYTKSGEKWLKEL